VRLYRSQFTYGTFPEVRQIPPETQSVYTYTGYTLTLAMLWKRGLSSKVVVVVAVLVVGCSDTPAAQPTDAHVPVRQCTIYYAFYGGRSCFNIRVKKGR